MYGELHDDTKGLFIIFLSDFAWKHFETLSFSLLVSFVVRADDLTRRPLGWTVTLDRRLIVGWMYVINVGWRISWVHLGRNVWSVTMIY